VLDSFCIYLVITPIHHGLKEVVDAKLCRNKDTAVLSKCYLKSSCCDYIELEESQWTYSSAQSSIDTNLAPFSRYFNISV